MIDRVLLLSSMDRKTERDREGMKRKIAKGKEMKLKDNSEEEIWRFFKGGSV